ncbi:MAG: hypothetical protein NWE79_04660 [Candidatus Bathyarchaeota archaeon]|jgi:hypothetical protein|nr:hypothetical protein [Candidatus Bathyarchaeota archaeon]
MALPFWDALGLWVAAIFTFSVLSFLWKDNIYFKFGQQFIVGVVVAHSILTSMQAVYNNGIVPIMTQGRITLIIPMLAGLLAYTRLRRDIAWASKYPVAIMIGVGTGSMVVGTLRGQIIGQLSMSITDVFKSSNPTDMLNGLIIFVGVITSLSFFVFTREHTGALGLSAKIGRIFLMVSLGANWAAETVWYLTQMTGRIMFLYNEWLFKAILGQ